MNDNATNDFDTFAPSPNLARVTTDSPVNESARPFRGRRSELGGVYQLRPDLRPDNDNKQQKAAA